MSLRCEPGDLAVIVGVTGVHSIYNGRFCDVIATSRFCDWLIYIPGQDDGSEFHAYDSNLIPLRGNPDAATETRDEVSA